MKTIACIATVKGREKYLQNAINTLVNQVDEVFVVTRTNFIPKGVSYIKRDNTKGDADKFYLYCKNPGLAETWFFCDDDLLYPPDYIEKSLDHLKKYPNSVLSYHGRTILPRPIEHYYAHSRIKSFRCTEAVSGYHNIGTNGTLGTGVMFFNSGTLKLDIDDFKLPNMADIWVSKFSIEQEKEMIACPHDNGWIVAQDIGRTPTIFDTHQFDDSKQTEVYNSINLHS